MHLKASMYLCLRPSSTLVLLILVLPCLASVFETYTLNDSRFEEFLDWNRPNAVSVFFDEIWEKNYLHIQRNDPSYYKGLASSSDLDFIIFNQKLLTNKDIKLIKDGSIAVHKETPVSVEDVYSAFEQGVSIAMNAFHGRSPVVASLVHELEETLATFSNANLYVTPRGNAGLSPHYDMRDVFIMQVEGYKQWRLWPPFHALPGTLVEVTKEALGSLQPIDLVLRAGDMLYFPRGWSHAPFTAPDTHSMHLTVGVDPMRWDEIFVRSLTLQADRQGTGSHSKSSTAKGRTRQPLVLRETIPFSSPEVTWLDVMKALIYSCSQTTLGLREGFPLRVLGLKPEATSSVNKGVLEEKLNDIKAEFGAWASGVYVQDLFPMFGWMNGQTPSPTISADALQATLMAHVQAFLRGIDFDAIVYSVRKTFMSGHTPRTAGHLAAASHGSLSSKDLILTTPIRKSGLILSVFSRTTVPPPYSEEYHDSFVVATNGRSIKADYAAEVLIGKLEALSPFTPFTLDSSLLSSCSLSDEVCMVSGLALIRDLLRAGYLEQV